MRPLIYSLFGLGLVAVGWFSASAKPPATKFDNDFPAFNSPVSKPPASTNAPPSSRPVRSSNDPDPFFDSTTTTSRLSSAQNVYAATAENYAVLLTDDEARAETNELERKIAVKKSDSNLTSVREQLQEIIEKYPSTPAAQRAAFLLQQFDAPTPADSAPADAPAGEAAPLQDGTTPADAATEEPVPTLR